MKKYFYHLTILLLTISQIKAQQTPITTVRKDSTIKAEVIRKGKFSTTLYTLNGTPVTENAVVNLLQSYPNAAYELASYKTQRKRNSTVVAVCTSIGFAALLGAIIQSNQARNESGSNFSKAPVLFSLSIGSFLSEIFLLKKNDHFTKAIQYYNSRS